MKNNTILTVVASLALGCTAFAGTTSGKGVAVSEPAAPESPLSTALTVGYASTYEYRGYDLGDNLFNVDLTSTYAVNDKLSLSLGAWYGTLWDGNYNELDLTGGATYDFGPLVGGVLYRHYIYDGDYSDNNEVGLSLATKDWNGLTFSLASFYDFEFEGYYFELGAAYNRQLTDMVGLSLTAGVSYVIEYPNDTVDGFNHAFVQAGLPLTLKENVTLTPFIRGVFPIDALDDAGADDLVLGGANLTVTF